MTDVLRLENGFLCMSTANHPISMKFVIQTKVLISRMSHEENRNFPNAKWRTDAILKFVCQRYLSVMSSDWCAICSEEAELYGKRN